MAATDAYAAPSHRKLVIFRLSDRLAGVDVENVIRIVPMPELLRPPGMPAALEGVLNLAGAAVPILRLDRLLGLPSQTVGLYSSLVIVGKKDAIQTGILADRVNDILPIPVAEILPVSKEDSFNACTEATTVVGEDVVHVLSLTQLLLAKEREALSEFCRSIDKRREFWEVGRA